VTARPDAQHAEAKDEPAERSTSRLCPMSAGGRLRRAYVPPGLHTVGAVAAVTQSGDLTFDGDNLAKRWGRHGDYWHWYRGNDHHGSAQPHFS
jgi:hypothetical protein